MKFSNYTGTDTLSRVLLLFIVWGYGLDDRAIEVRSPEEEERTFSSNLCVQTDSEAHPAPYPMGTGGPFPGQGVTITTHPI
jgi:hypothetical protein